MQTVWVDAYHRLPTCSGKQRRGAIHSASKRATTPRVANYTDGQTANIPNHIESVRAPTPQNLKLLRLFDRVMHNETVSATGTIYTVAHEPNTARHKHTYVASHLDKVLMVLYCFTALCIQDSKHVIQLQCSLPFS